jgi:alcohol dehydrogenase
MRAVYFERHGGPEVLRLGELQTPEPGPTDVLVRVKACALNHHDVFTRRGMPGITTPLPMVLGCDVAGTIEVLGAEVEDRRVGDRVLVDPLVGTNGMIGDTVWGGLAEFVRVEAEQLLELPDEVDAVTAACLPVAYGTSYRMLVTRGRVQSGESVLILGASGGVGTSCVQLCTMLGARVVAAASTPYRCTRLLELGADETIDTSTEDIVEYTRRTTGRLFSGGGYDVVVNFTGGDTWVPSLRCAKMGGRVLTCGATAGFDPKTDLRYIWTAELDVRGSDGWQRADLLTVLEEVRAGRLSPVIDRVLPLDRAPEGIALLESRSVFGKVVVEP